ncbi:Na(+)/H(+) antiporter subunit A [Marivirga tractuosa]|uniref:NADH/Ubiquinone/plastoquinone (Complex I) n=1 Tax=Marivirga tractuosa (strain ATCC 23168 / DSM 4126 / NBRC 15989 / NCIMB 1408 / VKM B-1430 / H-43) TaxID=643867 RepID=E4TPP8_MARTH|nr:hydrogen gas-evolving membrane-bound hydrogenase subunit E [Marivirga tractuosa]ADR22612.1 NADH/Ubiquinone/plastoquinone (complex I) [Marivirga tractuosa DSM 4126]BDD16717.1 Na(+)/H(+) antiporter subunit A [Marivirga tractuosa]
MIICILSIFILAFLVPLFQKFLADKLSFFLSIAPLSIFISLLHLYLTKKSFPISDSLEWNSYFNLELAFYLDGLSFLFSLLISGIGFLIYIYAGFYMKDAKHKGRFFMILTLFMGAMLGLVLADNWLSILVFWELTSITSFLLIGHNNEKKSARYAAWQGLLITAFGGLALLAGLVLTGIVTDEYTISNLSQHHELLTHHTLYIPILLCVAVGAFTKSAQFPFHFWLPNAMAAPTPVSAYLHSATMVKAGIYFFARFSPILGGTVEWQMLLSSIGGITMIVGAIMAFKSDNIKKLLAYSTISALGIMTMAYGIGTETAVFAGTVYIIAHALYKSTLFMMAGILDKQTGTKKISEFPKLLYKKLPVAFVIVCLAAFSFAGIAPFFGFVAKELLLEMVLHSSLLSSFYIAAVLITSVFFVAVFFVLTHKAFFSKEVKGELKKVHKGIFVAPLVTALAGLAFGIFPDTLSHSISKASATIFPTFEAKHLALWHGFNDAFYLSLLSILLGTAIYFTSLKLNWKLKLSFFTSLQPSKIYDRLFKGIISLGKWQTSKIQTGYLRNYAMVTLLVILILTGYTFLFKAGIRIDTAAIDVYFFELILGLIVLIALGFTLFTRSNISALLSLSVVGIAISIIFLEAGAPDLAITFILIDALTITVFVLILHKLPKKMLRKRNSARVRDAIIALGTGLLITLILFSITYDPLNSKLKEFYAENSYSAAKGKNMVNVILVDFRVLDTLGEISVLAIAALGVFALVNYSKNRKSL